MGDDNGDEEDNEEDKDDDDDDNEYDDNDKAGDDDDNDDNNDDDDDKGGSLLASLSLTQGKFPDFPQKLVPEITKCSTVQNLPCLNYQARACALRALGLLLADGTPTVGGGKTF